MASDNSILVCTFVNSDKFLEKEIAKISSIFKIDGNIFVFNSKNDQNRIVLTYNIINDQKYEFPKNTLQIHRRSSTNTLYTLNALDKLINEGMMELQITREQYKIDWPMYKNSLIIMQKEKGSKVLAVIELELKQIIKSNKEKGN